jgi:hypothetical protein
MSSPPDLTGLNKIHLGDFANRFRRDAISHGRVFSYFAAALPFGEEEMREYIEEPIAALPAKVLSSAGKVVLLFVPFIEKPGKSKAKPARNGKRHVVKPEEYDPRDCMVGMDPPDPAQNIPVVYLPPSDESTPHTLAFGVQEMESSDYHYNFYYSIANLVYMNEPEAALAGYRSLLREELKSRVHGEVDEPSWKAKLEMLQRESGIRGESKLFREYARRSFVDSMTLYLHGICCDIDVEPGPRQIASRFLRKRLQFLQSQFPQPAGYALFPEELKS